MPKVKKIRAPALQKSKPVATGKSMSQHEQPLGQMIQDDTNRNLYAKSIKSSVTKHPNGNTDTKMNDKRNKINDDDDDDDYYNDKNNTNDDNVDADVLDAKSSQRIMTLSMEQQMEIRQSEIMKNVVATTTTTNRLQQQQQQQSRTGMNDNRKKNDDDSDDDDDDEEDNNNHLPNNDGIITSNDDDYYVDRVDDGKYVDMVDTTMMGISPEDEAIIATMMKGRCQPRDSSHNNNNNNDNNDTNHSTTQPPKTLADMILEKIAQKEQQQQQQQNTIDDDDMMEQQQPQLPPKVIEVYTDIGKILSRYTSGKLPKAFKVIPSLSNWEEVLYITRPDQWTPSAMYAATRIFASNCNVKMATKFYNLVLLDSIRNDIYTNKKLNYHYYMSLKKSIYKPQSFFKGILLPLCYDGNCTLREAAIVASVLQRVSIPVHHAAVAIHKLATMHKTTGSTTTTHHDTTTTTTTISPKLMSEYSGATSIFLKTLFNKKYSLPTPVIQSVIQYFTNFIYCDNNNNNTTTTSTIVLPVLWHQALLVFIQRYKNAIPLDDTSSTRDVFRKLLKQHYHHKITPEIRRELFGNIQAYQEEQQIVLQHKVNHVPMTIDKRQPMEM